MTRLRAIAAWMVGLLASAAAGFPAEPPGAVEEVPYIRWNVTSQRLDARMKDAPLAFMLEQLAGATHWKILYEPAAEHRTFAVFKDAPLGDGLRRLLGPLNYAYVPGGPGPAQLLVFSTSASEATELVPAPETSVPSRPRRIENELILQVAAGSEADIEALARSLDAEIVGRLEALGAYRLRFKDAAAAAAARRRLESEDRGRPQDNYAIDHPGLGGSRSQLGLPNTSIRPGNAQGNDQVVVAVIDTQVQPEGPVLPDFLLPAINVTGAPPPASDILAHGTSMASTVLNSVAVTGGGGESPVRILPVDVYGTQPATSSFAIAQGIHAALTAGADVINLSLGGDGGTPLIREVIAAGRAAGAVFVGAAGNEPLTTPTYPAAFPEVIAVTALEPDGQLAAYANRGDFVDVGAPGLSVVPFRGRPYYVVGTSAATAYVSGQAALLIANDGLRGPSLEAALRQGMTASPTATGP